MKPIYAIGGLLLAVSASAAQSSPQSLQVTRIFNVTSSWVGECAAGVIDNRSTNTRHNNFHTLAATGSGTWSVALYYSDTACSGPWTTFGNPTSLTNTSETSISALGYHPYLKIVVTGSAAGTYSAAKDFFPMGAGASGSPGQGVPTGGTTGKVLAKLSNTDYDTDWVTPTTTAGGSSGQLQVNQSGGFNGITMSGDCSINTSTGAITCTKTSGSSFGTAATANLTALFQLGAGNAVTTGNQDFSAATNFRAPNVSGYTPTLNGQFGYDTAASSYKGYVGASVKTFAFLDSNITGLSGGLNAQYINWNASSGGTSIANKPTIPTVTGSSVLKGSSGNAVAAAGSDVVSLFTGTPTGAKFLRDDGTIAVPAGDVAGPGSSTNTAVVRFSGTTGKILQNSGVTIDGSDNVTATSFNGDATKNGADYLQGVTSGGLAFSVANIAGTAVTLIWPADTSTATTGYVPTLGGTVTCPTLLPSWAPSTCRSLSWGVSGSGTANPASVVTTTFSATPTFTCPSASAGTVTTFLLSTALTANITSSTLATCTSGQTLHFVMAQDVTGGRTVAMPTGFDGAPVSPTASKTTTLTYAWDGTSGHLINSSTDDPSVLFLTERAAPGTPASGKTYCWPDSTNHVWSCKSNNSSTVSSMVVPATATTGQFVTAISAGGVISKAAIVATDLPPAAVPTPGTTITLAAPAGYAICTGTCTVTLPVPAAGYQFCIRNDTAVTTAITLAALGSSARYEATDHSAYGTAGTGTLAATAAAGNQVCIVGRDSTHYHTYSYTGTWTAN